MCEERDRNRSKEAGFALILAILALMLLTFLGLTLAATTSTELQVATNYRWSVQARYNAEAGIEAAKEILQGLNWAAVLPGARAAWTPAGTIPVTGVQPTVPFPGATRNFELGPCDARGNGVGYGVVLHDGTRAYENVTTVPGMTTTPPPLNGAFTLWIRRATVPTATAGQYQDDNTTTDSMVLTAEGVAPYVGTQMGMVFARANVARRVVEVSVRRQAQPSPCSTRGGQIGGGPEGNNAFGGPCGGLGTDPLGGYLSPAGGFITGTGAAQ